MRALLLSCVFASTIAFTAFAADEAEHAAPAVKPVTTAPVAPATLPAPAAPVAVPLTKPQPITAELNDGSKIEMDAYGMVWVLGANGSKNLAPDGLLTLKDGTPLVVKEGKRVSEE